MNFALFDFISADYTAEFLFPRLSQKESGAGYTQMRVIHGGYTAIEYDRSRNYKSGMEDKSWFSNTAVEQSGEGPGNHPREDI